MGYQVREAISDEFIESCALKKMHRKNDPDTSIAAAEAVSKAQGPLHKLIYKQFQKLGPMHDETLENLPEFYDQAGRCLYSPSTVRKRRTELYHAGLLKPLGKEKNSRNRSMVVWGIA